MNLPVDPQHQDSPVSTEEQTSTTIRDSDAESIQESEEDDAGNTRDDRPPDTTTTIETAVKEVAMKEMDEDTPQAEEVCDQTQDGELVGTSEFKSSDIQSKSAVDQQTMNQSNSREIPVEELHDEYSVKDNESRDKEEDTEKTAEERSFSENIEMEESVQTETVSSPQEELSVREERHVHFQVSEVRDAHNLDADLQKVHEMHEIQVHSDLQAPEHTGNISEPAGFSSTGNRRKLGSSRRHKGRRQVQDSAAETHRELEAEVVEATRDDGINETPSSSQVSHQEHANDGTSRSSPLTVAEEEEDPQVENLEGSSSEEEAETKNLIKTEEKHMREIPDKCKTEDTGLIRVDDSLQDEVEQKYEDSADKELTAQEINMSHEISHAENFDAAHNNSDTFAPLDISHEEQQPALDASEDTGTSIVDSACKSQQEEKALSVYSDNVQKISKQTRKTFGSHRKSQINRKQKYTTDNDETEENTLNAPSDEMEMLEEVATIYTTDIEQSQNAEPSISIAVHKGQDMNETSAVVDPELHSSTRHLHGIENNIKAEDLMAASPEAESPHLSDDVETPVQFVLLPNVFDVDVERLQPDIHFTSVVSESNSGTKTECAINIDSPITQSFYGFTQSASSDQERNLIQDQDANEQNTKTEVGDVADLNIVKSVMEGGAGERKDAHADTQGPKTVSDRAQDTKVEMKNTSPNSNVTNRRRKLGSTRRSLGFISKREGLHQKVEDDNKMTEAATNVDVSESVAGIEEQTLGKPGEDHLDSEPGEENGSSDQKHSARQIREGSPVPEQLEETDHQVIAHDIPARSTTAPKQDVMSQSVSGRRKRKMGSRRKIHGQQTHENQTAREREERIYEEAEKAAEISTGESETAYEHRDQDLDKKSEADEKDKKPSFGVSGAQTGEQSRPVRNKTPQVAPTRHGQDDVILGQKNLTSDQFNNAKGNTYNVVMVGDSGVGKTSFMRRAQTGKFSMDIPSSICLDMCLWTVVVDGKPVVLRLWDTAGQERFHSITRQIFNKAQAFLLMYDITSSKSFTAVRYWVNCIQESAVEKVTILVLGNKNDNAEREVKTEEGESLAKEYNSDFLECSAATGDNVVQSLENVARLLSEKANRQEESLKLEKEPRQKRTSRCC
ncbi:uncharacterized protein rab44 [Aulostomus maculatus]